MVRCPRGMCVALALGPTLCLPVDGADRAGADRREAIRKEITPELRLAVARGFDHLIRKQDSNGDFDSSFPVAIDALVGLAFLAGGHSEKTSDELSKVIRKGTSALLARQTDSGYFNDGSSVMYGHGFATLYLAELYGTSDYRQAEIRTALEKAIRLIETAQGEGGGWDYTPDKVHSLKARSFGSSDTSITVCQTLALRASKNIGIQIDPRVIDRARIYIENAQVDDGGFRYRDLGIDAPLLSGSAFPRSAAGVCVLYSLGTYKSESIKKGFDYLYKSYQFPWVNEFPYYGHFYCAQAMFQAGGKYWAEYFPWIRKELLSLQKSNGGWTESPRENANQATAMALIVLQLPYRFLPIHER
jgi:hypothetical protein